MTGIDPIQEKVDSINRGESYILDVPNSVVRKHVEAGGCAPPPITAC